MSDLKSSSSQHTILRSNRGQIVVEYVLLLVVAVGVAVMITSQMVSRNSDNPGFLVQKWSAIINLIGSDTADDLTSAQQ